MPERILITGGGGFVGSHLADALLAAGHRVTVLDVLEPQVHGRATRPARLNPEVDFVAGDVLDVEVLEPLVLRADVVFHLAALVGVTQSMYAIRRYTEANVGGAATLLQVLAERRGPIRKLIVASSNTVYGEGVGRCPSHGRVLAPLRPEGQLARRDWEVRCPTCDAPLASLPTDEAQQPAPASVYAISKRSLEELALVVGRAYGLPTVALRFFNIYGSGQALTNPYTGVATMFCARMLNDRPPLIFEDGNQTRDFVHVSDIVQGCLLAMERPSADYGVLNLGTGRPLSVRQIAETLARELGWRGGLEITNTYRVGDVRHCFADVGRARGALGYAPRVAFEDGARELVAWVASQPPTEDHVAAAAAELSARGLAR